MTPSEHLKSSTRTIPPSAARRPPESPASPRRPYSMDRGHILMARRLTIKAAMLIGILAVLAGSILVVAWQAPLVQDQIVADE